MILVFIDDLTGAAEIAGIGHRYGLRSEVHFDIPEVAEADVVVIDA